MLLRLPLTQIIVGGADELEDEVAGRAGLAPGNRAVAEHALTMLVDADLLLDLITVGRPPTPPRPS